MFEQVSRPTPSTSPFTVNEGGKSRSSKTFIPALAAVIMFVFMMVTQLENCALICLSGHLSSDTQRPPVTEQLAPRRSICSTFQSMDLLLALQSQGRPRSDADIARAYIGPMSKIMQNCRHDSPVYTQFYNLCVCS